MDDAGDGGDGDGDAAVVSSESLTVAGQKVSKLLARGLAAKEAAGKDLLARKDSSEEEADTPMRAQARAASSRVMAGDAADDGGDDGGFDA